MKYICREIYFDDHLLFPHTHLHTHTSTSLKKLLHSFFRSNPPPEFYKYGKGPFQGLYNLDQSENMLYNKLYDLVYSCF